MNISNKIKKKLDRQLGPFPWVSEAYGFGKWLRIYGYYPKFLPINIFCEHSGPNFQHEIEGISVFDKQNLNFNYLTHSEFKRKEWERLSSKEAFILPNPFVFYLNKKRIKQDENANGTIVYPFHTVPSIKYEINVKEYSRELRDLPNEYHPITISLHIHDINLGLDKEWIKEGFKVVCAGDPFSENFIESFFDILKKHKLALSNYAGSYIFYSVLINIPFFYFGKLNAKEIEHYDNNGIEFGIGENAVFDLFSIKEIKYLDINNFKNLIISEDLKNYVIKMLNFENRISRFKLSILLYKLFFKRIFKNG